MGVTLVHEHVLVDFVGAEKVSRSRYDADEAFRDDPPPPPGAAEARLPHAPRVHARVPRPRPAAAAPPVGGERPPHRHEHRLLRRRRNDIAVPPHAYAETAAAARRTGGRPRSGRGIEGTGIRPGFVKIGVDSGPALRHRPQARRGGGAVPPRHRPHPRDPHRRRRGRARDPRRARGASASRRRPTSGSTPRTRRTARPARWAAQQGAWVELDELAPRASRRTSRRCWTSPPRTGSTACSSRRTRAGTTWASRRAATYRPHTFLFDAFVPALRARGLGEADIRTLLVENPARAFAVRRRALPGAA